MNTKQIVALVVGIFAAGAVLLLPGNRPVSHAGPMRQVSSYMYEKDFYTAVPKRAMLSLWAVTGVTLAAVYLLRPRKAG